MKYIILELIPTSSNPDNGDIIQLSALKVHDLNLVDRFDMRLADDKIKIPDLLDLISYDKELFKYVDSTKELLDLFIAWSSNYKLIMIDNEYTINYLKNLNNEMEFIHDLLGLSSSDQVLNDIVKKYNLEPSDYIVDLMYEAIIYENPKKE